MSLQKFNFLFQHRKLNLNITVDALSQIVHLLTMVKAGINNYEKIKPFDEHFKE